MSETVFYHGTPKFKIGSSKVNTYICVSDRSIGKTTYWIATATIRCLNAILNGTFTREKFYFLRRSTENIEKVVSKGIYNSVLTVPEYAEKLCGYTHETIADGKIFLSNAEDKKICVGYIGDLNDVKGVSVEDCDTLIFDEFIEASRQKYKGGDGGANEPELLARLDETLFRNKQNYFILLANADCPSDPYREYFNIPYGVERFSIPERKIYYEYVHASEELKEKKSQSSTGLRWQGTRYWAYSNGESTMIDVDESLLTDKPKHAKHEFNFIIAGSNITCWRDENTNVFYFHDNYNFDPSKPIFSVLSKDMRVDTMFLAYNLDIIRLFKLRYGMGRIRFNNQKTASLFNIMISLNK